MSSTCISTPSAASWNSLDSGRSFIPSVGLATAYETGIWGSDGDVGLCIRWRLTLWNTLALAIVLLGFTALVYGLMRHALYERLDRSLLTEVRELEEKPNQGLSHWIAEAKEHHNIFCVMYDAGGKVYARTEELPANSIPPAPATPRAGSFFIDATLPVLEHQRLLTAHLNLAGKAYTVLLM